VERPTEPAVVPDSTVIPTEELTPPEPEEGLPDSTIQSLLEFPLPSPDSFMKRWEPGFFLILKPDPRLT